MTKEMLEFKRLLDVWKATTIALTNSTRAVLDPLRDKVLDAEFEAFRSIEEKIETLADLVKDLRKGFHDERESL